MVHLKPLQGKYLSVVINGVKILGSKQCHSEVKKSLSWKTIRVVLMSDDGVSSRGLWFVELKSVL